MDVLNINISLILGTFALILGLVSELIFKRLKNSKKENLILTMKRKRCCSLIILIHIMMTSQMKN